MFYEKELDFLINIFTKCGLPAETHKSGESQLEGAGEIFRGMAGHLKGRTLYKMTDVFRCNYMFFQLPETEEEQVLLIGPYITEEYKQEAILEQAEALGVEPQKAAEFEKRYGEILRMSEDSKAFAVLDVFCDLIWGEDGYEYVNLNNIDAPAFSNFTLMREKEELRDDLRMIEAMEQRYAFENQFMDAVSKGQIYKAERFFNSISVEAFEQRLPDTLRNTKNYMIIMNTLLRKAAERGGVHPVYLDNLSSSYAREIEKFNTLQMTPAFMRKMFESYCKLVNKHNTAGYSKVVKKAVIYIASDLSADLSLRKVAELNGVSPGYLSACFKKETGKNFIDYVNTERMSQAKHLLKTTGLQVQTIAQHCGFIDLQYFSKVFKRYTGKTPRQYREDVRKVMG